MGNDNFTTEQIIDRLGNPEDFAKAHLGDLLSNGSRLDCLCVYSIVSFSEMFAISYLVIMTSVFYCLRYRQFAFKAVKMIDYILKFGLPHMENMGVFTGLVELNPIAEFVGILKMCIFIVYM